MRDHRERVSHQLHVPQEAGGGPGTERQPDPGQEREREVRHHERHLHRTRRSRPVHQPRQLHPLLHPEGTVLRAGGGVSAEPRGGRVPAGQVREQDLRPAASLSRRR